MKKYLNNFEFNKQTTLSAGNFWTKDTVVDVVKMYTF